MAATKITPVFTQVAKSVGSGEKIIPVIRSFLYSKDFPDFTVKVRGSHNHNRKPDGWFHPSEHPTWNDRQLYYYMAYPNQVIKEPLDPLSTMTVTAGSFWHSFITVCLDTAGYLVAHDVPVEDKVHRSRGEMDGKSIDEAWEFKTMNENKMGRIPTGAPDDPVVLSHFKEKLPKYYGQAQEYLRLSGLPTMRFLIMHTAYPFPMREIAVPYNPAFAEETRSKYARVLQAVADQRPPEVCCGARTQQAQECPARAICPIGRM